MIAKIYLEFVSWLKGGMLKIVLFKYTDAWIYYAAVLAYLDHFWNKIRFMDGTFFNYSIHITSVTP